MGNIVIKEILASDTVSNLVDKINFNFDQLLLNGGGPMGLTGTTGPTGPLGPRGTVWFTSGDIYNTSLTTTPAPPLLFPLWTGTAQKVNNISLPGYPQFKGDPNKYQPIATTSTPNTYPYFSFVIGTTGKLPKSGDLYLQEGDDSFNGYSSLDGDIWEFNSIANTWTYTGVNIKGDTGATGSTGATEWIRTTDTTTTVDALHPYVITGQNPAVRILVGTDDTTKIEESLGVYTDNVMTIYRDSTNAPGYNLAFTDDGSISAPSFSTVDYANITTTGNQFILQGFSSALSDTYNVSMIAPAGNVILQAFSPVGLLNTQIDVTLDLQQRKFTIVNAALDVSCSPTTPTTGVVTHRFTDNTVSLSILHNQSITYGSWAEKFIRLQTRAVAGVADLILSDSTSIDTRVGIGEWVTSRPSAKFTVANSGSASVPAMVVGNSWSKATTTFTEVSTNTGNIQGATYLQGMLSIGATNSVSQPTIFGSPTLNSISTASGIGIKGGLLSFNVYSDNVGTPALKSMGNNNYGNYAIGHGAFLNTFTGSNAADLTSDTFVLTSSDSVVSTQGNSLTGGLQGSQLFNVNMFLKSNTKQFGFNTTFNTGYADFNSRGGAIIGKIKSYGAESFIGHEDAQVNKNIIIGWPKDYLGSNISASPRIITNSGVTGETNLIYLTTPTWSGSMRFDSTTIPLIPKIKSYISESGNAYNQYFPSSLAQHKVINGINYPVITNQLSYASNPYDTGVGVEIENRIQAPTAAAGTITRTPITRFFNAGGTSYVKGNRPLLVSKRDMNDNTQILLEVSTTNNVAVGGVIKYPQYSIFNLYRPSTIGDAMGYAPNSGAISGSAVTSPYNSPWSTNYLVNSSFPSDNSSSYSVAVSNLTSFITGDYDRSLHVNTIYPNNTGQNNVDQHNSKVKAGIVINAEALNNNAPFPPTAQGLGYAQYANSLFQSYHQITTSPLMVNYTPGSDTGIKMATPLGIKPGPVTFFRASTAQLYTKGSDLILSGGDFVAQYNTGSQFSYNNNPPKPGDVFITGGQTFTDVINKSGAANAIYHIKNTTGQDIEKRNFGNIYIGSNITPSELTNNTTSFISKTSPVYVGYQSNDFAIWESSLTTSVFSPKGNATLNIAAPDDNLLLDYGTGVNTLTTLKPSGKALNIQKGDVVTANQEAGWVEINLGSGSFLSGASSNCITSNWNGTGPTTSLNLQSARYVVGSGITPRWIVSYKVIGYTVFYKIELQSVLFSTVSSVGVNDSPYIYLGTDALFATVSGVNSGKLPRPALITTTNVYDSTSATGQYGYTNYLNNGGVYSPSFFGNGYVSIRQNRAGTYPLKTPWPYGGTAYNKEMLRVPINAGIITSGQVWMQLMPIGAGTYLWSDSMNYDIKEETQAMLDANYKKLIPFAGNYLHYNGSGTAAPGTEIQVDIFFSGQYELDPQYWFV